MPALRPASLLSLCSLLAIVPLTRGADAGASPFLPAGGAPTVEAAPTQDAQIELRGVMSTGGTTMFSIYDLTKHTSYWLRLNDAGHEFVVRSYDAARDLVTVDFQGRSLSLALKTAKVASAPVNMPQSIAGPPMQQPGGPPIGGPVVLNPTPADEQRRMEAVAAEVNRRRLVRQQTLQASRQAAGQFPAVPAAPAVPGQRQNR